MLLLSNKTYTQSQLAHIFDILKQNITKHIREFEHCNLIELDRQEGKNKFYRATKYLANMYLFKWLQIFNTEKDTIKSKNLLVQSHTSHTDTRLKDFRIREAIYA